MHTFVVLAYKESRYLEECIKSVLNQSFETNVVIATSTPNKYINDLAKKYKLKIIINEGKEHGIGNDFNFAVNCINTKLVTIAHQDDVYDRDYAKNIIERYKKFKDSVIIFTDYYEIRNGNKIYKNKNLKIKRILLSLINIKWLSKIKLVKRSSICIGNAICCPSVTFVKSKMPKEVFKNNFKCNVDWDAWERLSKIKGNFIFISKCLMGHRVHSESTTTEIINSNNRSKEDLEMFNRFWPKSISTKLCRVYKNSEKNNNMRF